MAEFKKLEYEKRFFNFEQKQHVVVSTVEITDDGAIVLKKYRPLSRKTEQTTNASCSVEEFEELCKEIRNCIDSADRLESFTDDCDEELKIFCNYGRVQRMDRGLGNADTCIGSIVSRFLLKHLRAQ